MRIVAIDHHAVDVEMTYAFHLSMGRTECCLDTTIVRIETDIGLIGWARSVPSAGVTRRHSRRLRVRRSRRLLRGWGQTTVLRMFRGGAGIPMA